VVAPVGKTVCENAFLNMDGNKPRAAMLRERAAECEQVANQLSFEPAKNELLEGAKRLRALAEDAERQDS
jgi:hypothetical protein